MSNILKFLNKSDKETLRQWLLGHVVRDPQTGEIVHHRIWFKTIFNPFLRKYGLVIATKVDDKTGKLMGYIVRKYDNSAPLQPDHPELPGG